MCSLISFKSHIWQIEKSWQKYLVKMTMHKNKDCSFRNYVIPLCDLGRPFQKVWVNLRRTLWISFKDTSKLRSQGSSGKTIRGLTDSCSRIWLEVVKAAKLETRDKFTEKTQENKKMSKNLNEAAMAGNLEEVLLRLNLGEDVNQMLFPRYSTPLHDATTCGRIQIAKVLIER